jgi:RNA polymerase sigma-70 factor (ECF subfamily)
MDPSAPTPDEPLVERARAGDKAAFGLLVQRHSAVLFPVCVRVTGDAALAEDALQEAFVQAWQALPRFEGRARFSTWLHRIAVNAALNQRRARAPWGRRLVDDPEGAHVAAAEDETPGPEQQAHAAGLGAAAAAAMEQLTPLERAAFVLRHHEGASIQEIRAALGGSDNAVKHAIFRAVRKLRAALGPYVDDHDFTPAMAEDADAYDH